MAYDIERGGSALRKEVIDSIVKQVAQDKYKMKQACAVVSTNSWQNTFIREDTDGVSNVSGNDTEGIPRGAAFPQASLGHEKHSVYVKKFGMEYNIDWEDILASDFNIQARLTVRTTERVVKSVDRWLIRKLSDDFFSTALAAYNTEDLEIQSYAINHATTGRWDESSAAIINDLMAASEKISDFYYDTDGLTCFVSPKDKRYINKWLADKGSQWEKIAEGIATNGKVAKVHGITLVEVNAMPASYAILLKPKTCATIYQLVPIRTATTDDPFKSMRVRVVEELGVGLTDPKTIVLIKNTQSGNA